MREGYNGNAVKEISGEIERKDSICSENMELIRIAQQDGAESDEAMRATEQLLKINRGLVRKIAYRFRDRGVELEDLEQIGTIGMIKAIRSFDRSMGNCFSTYAVPLIFGEIRRHLRDEGPIKVGRNYKRLGATLINCKNTIMANEGREAHISEIADMCGVSVEEAAMAIDAISPIASLSDSVYSEDDGVELGDILPDEDSVNYTQKLIERMTLSKAISDMPPMWQKIVALRYFRNMTQQRVADALGVTQVKISREEKKILAYLKERMK